MSNPSTAATSNPAIPTAAQLAETRLRQWHQQGEALLTIENLRGWINAAGLALFAPRPQIASPAPSLIEAVLGGPNANPTLEQTAEARGLLARLVAEGLAVPLNLLGPGAGTVHAGAPGDMPDFVASAAVFSYVFTLRGDKAWKQPPATSGALKVSNLALAAHEALSRRGPLTAYDLTAEVGKEVTEAAVLRALGELWTHLRVLPMFQPNGAPTLWELTSARFTKQIKAGANAGQPSALSALISLYLGQAIVASEDEIESFLSPLASRSRIRDVIHALLSARQLDTLAIEGRTMLHVAGALPAFLALESEPAPPELPVAGEVAVELAATNGAQDTDATGEAKPRITKFVPRPRKIGTGYLAKAKPAKFGAKPGPFERGPKPGGLERGFKPASGRERRPFSKPATPGFDKPWDEKPPRPGAERRPSGAPENAAESRTRDARFPRKTFSKPGTFGRKSEGFAARAASDGRSPRSESAPRGERGGPPMRNKNATSGARPALGKPRAPGSYAPRPKGDRPAGGRAGGYQGDRAARGKGDGFAPRKPYAPRGAGFFSSKPRSSDDKGGPNERQHRGQSVEGGKRVYRKFDAPRDRPPRSYSSDRSASSGRPARAEGSGGDARKPSGDFPPRKFAGKGAPKAGGKPGGFARKPIGKPGSGFDGKKPYAKSGAPFSGKPSNTFAKFASNKKPFGKRPPGRKFKPTQGESS